MTASVSYELPGFGQHRLVIVSLFRLLMTASRKSPPERTRRQRRRQSEEKEAEGEEEEEELRKARNRRDGQRVSLTRWVEFIEG